MTETELNARIEKLKRRTPLLQSQAHLEKIIGSFPEAHRTLAIEAVSGILPEKLVAREPKPVIVPKDPENPTIQEATAMRLEAHGNKIVEQANVMAEMGKRIGELEAENSNLKGRANEGQKVKG